MSNKSSICGGSALFKPISGYGDADIKKYNYAVSIACKQYNALKKKRKQERQNKRKGRR